MRANGVEVLLASDPDLSSLEELFLPYRNDLLDSVDAEVTSLERGLPVSRRYRNHQAGFPDLQPTEPVMDRDPGELPQVCQLRQPAAHFAGDAWHRKVVRTVWTECVPLGALHRQVYIIYVDIPPVCEVFNGAAMGHLHGLAVLNGEHLRSLLVPPPHTAEHCPNTRGSRVNRIGTLAHELGHAFGLRHPSCIGSPDCADDTIMGSGSRHFPSTYIEETDFPRLHSVLQRGLPYMGPY